MDQGFDNGRDTRADEPVAPVPSAPSDEIGARKGPDLVGAPGMSVDLEESPPDAAPHGPVAWEGAQTGSALYTIVSAAESGRATAVGSMRRHNLIDAQSPMARRWPP